MNPTPQDHQSPTTKTQNMTSSKTIQRIPPVATTREFPCHSRRPLLSFPPPPSCHSRRPPPVIPAGSQRESKKQHHDIDRPSPTHPLHVPCPVRNAVADERHLVLIDEGQETDRLIGYDDRTGKEAIRILGIYGHNPDNPEKNTKLFAPPWSKEEAWRRRISFWISAN